MRTTLAFVGTLVMIGLCTSCRRPPTLPPNSRWVSNKGCPSGGFYQTSGPPPERCRCWGHCGYICTRNNGGGSAPAPPPSSPCPFGGVWYNNRGERCVCQSFNQKPYYRCTPTTTAAPPSTVPSTGPSTVPPGTG